MAHSRDLSDLQMDRPLPLWCNRGIGGHVKQIWVFEPAVPERTKPSSLLPGAIAGIQMPSASLRDNSHYPSETNLPAQFWEHRPPPVEHDGAIYLLRA